MFDLTVQIIAVEIQKLKILNQDISELQKAIEVLRDGQGYLTANKPIEIKFYKEL